MAHLGSVRVVFYAGLEGAEPQRVGSADLPLNVTPVSTTKFEVDLSEALTVIRETLRGIFNDAR